MKNIRIFIRKFSIFSGNFLVYLNRLVFVMVDHFQKGLSMQKKTTTNKYSQLSLSRTPRDSMKHFEISVVRHIRFTELRKKQLIEQPPLTE